ncbi:MAG: 5-carboxymethyl-2-hydroxymuconate Delta-isomerase [Marinosulfonomonas sp.]
MPHVSLEFSQGIEKTHDIQSACDALFETLANHGAFDRAPIKIRAKPVEFFRIGTEPQSFVHATLLLMDGRDAETKAQITQIVLATLERVFPDVGSLTVQDVEMSRATYAKRVLPASPD